MHTSGLIKTIWVSVSRDLGIPGGITIIGVSVISIVLVPVQGMSLPVFLSSGKIYFELIEEECVPSLAPLTRAVERSMSPQFTANQLDALADEVLKRLPDTVRSILPDIAKSVLDD